MTELSRNDFSKAHSLGSGKLTDVKESGLLMALVGEKIAEGLAIPAHIQLARDVIRETVALNGKADDFTPNKELKRAAASQSMAHSVENVR